MSTKIIIEEKLRRAFKPIKLIVVDESHLHEGHSGYCAGGETHFRISIVSETFSGMGRLARHRAVFECLSDELASRVHALAIKADVP